MSLILDSSVSGLGLEAPSIPMPETRGELVTVLAHYHRAEIARMAGWRDRIDRTTNWALTVSAAMLSVALSTPASHHGVLLFAMLLVALLLRIEARRYRFFDVYRARVRRLERNYYAQILAPSGDVDRSWAAGLGEDLRRPVFLIGQNEAMSRRLRRNYGWLFLILLLAWLVKITPGARPPGGGGFGASLSAVLDDAALGPVPGPLVIVVIAAFYGWIVYAVTRRYSRSGELVYGTVHV